MFNSGLTIGSTIGLRNNLTIGVQGRKNRLWRQSDGPREKADARRKDPAVTAPRFCEKKEGSREKAEARHTDFRRYTTSPLGKRGWSQRKANARFLDLRRYNTSFLRKDGSMEKPTRATESTAAAQCKAAAPPCF